MSICIPDLVRQIIDAKNSVVTMIIRPTPILFKDLGTSQLFLRLFIQITMFMLIVLRSPLRLVESISHSVSSLHKNYGIDNSTIKRL